MILVRGLLRGMNRQAECDILARRVEIPVQNTRSHILGYEECSILTAPVDLPDGDYMAYFAGHSIVASRARGLWKSSGAAMRDPAADGLSEIREIALHSQQEIKTSESKSSIQSVEEKTVGVPHQRTGHSC